MIYPIITFISVLRKSQFEADADRYIKTELTDLPNANYIKKNAVYEYKPKGISVIELTTFGADEISEDAQMPTFVLDCFSHCHLTFVRILWTFYN